MAVCRQGVFVVFHLSYLVNTFPSNITYITTTPVMIDFSERNTSSSLIPVYTADEDESEGILPSKTSPTSCRIIAERRSMECDADLLIECPTLNEQSNFTTLVITSYEQINTALLEDKTLTNSCFNGGRELRNITITHFKICKLENDTFDGFDVLEYIDLSHNCIHDVSVLKNWALPNIISLNLSYNEISFIDLLVFYFPALKYLNLSYNHLISLKDGVFKSLENLQVLVLNGNNLDSLGSGGAFLGLKNLREMWLCDCQITSVPHSLFAHTPSLDFLTMSNNKMRHIPSDAISDLYFLHHLDLSSNEIVGIQTQAFQGLALQTLDLSNNRIVSITPMAFHSFRTENLYLQNNRIRVLPRKALKILARNLFAIDLSKNLLEGDRCFFPPELMHLTNLNLSGNDLPNIPTSIHHLYQLQVLDLTFNHISNLNSSELKLVKRMERVYLQGNPWICDCNIEELREVLQQQGNIPLKEGDAGPAEVPPRENVGRVLCERPPRLSGTAIVSVGETDLRGCLSTWSRVTPVFLYVVCSLISFIILGVLAFMWFKRKEMAYGRFCMNNDKGSYSSGTSQSPIKVISNTAAGADELAAGSHGPVKNQAWESALVITNPHSDLGAATKEGEAASVKEGQLSSSSKQSGAETIV